LAVSLVGRQAGRQALCRRNIGGTQALWQSHCRLIGGLFGSLIDSFFAGCLIGGLIDRFIGGLFAGGTLVEGMLVDSLIDSSLQAEHWRNAGSLQALCSLIVSLIGGLFGSLFAGGTLAERRLIAGSLAGGSLAERRLIAVSLAVSLGVHWQIDSYVDR
jgi:hypothetical protein